MIAGYSFIYKYKSSENFGLLIAKIEAEDFVRIGGDLEYVTHKNKTNPKTSIINSHYTEPMSFQMEIISLEPITNNDWIDICNWLASDKKYNRLKINNDLYEGYHMNCYMSEIEKIEFATGHHGLKVKVNCDSSFMWSDEKETLVYDTFPTFVEIDTHQRGYIYPEVVISVGQSGGNISVINKTDNNRTSTITDAQANEIIELMSNPKTIVGYNHKNIYESFNKKWLRFINGTNEINIDGDIAQIEITYEKARLFI